MFRHVRPIAVTNGKRARESLLPTSNDHDDVLLPFNGPFTNSFSFIHTTELKWFDKYLSVHTLPATGLPGGDYLANPASGLISTPALGDGGSDRHARGIVLKNLQLSGVIHKPADPVVYSPPEPVIIYLAVVADTATNGAQCGTSDVFTTPTNSLDLCFPPFRNMESATRFQVLKSEIFRLGVDATFTIDASVIPPEFTISGDKLCFNWFLPLDYGVTFNAGTTDSVSSVVDNSLHVFCVQSAGEQCYLTYKSRIRFADVVD